jgi:hypothetical protein
VPHNNAHAARSERKDGARFSTTAARDEQGPDWLAERVEFELSGDFSIPSRLGNYSLENQNTLQIAISTQPEGLGVSYMDRSRAQGVGKVLNSDTAVAFIYSACEVGIKRAALALMEIRAPSPQSNPRAQLRP